MAAPSGNTNASKINRLWADSIRRAVVQGDPEKLRKIAEKLLDMAEAGDIQAMREIGDRLDGKSVQHTDNKHEHRMAESLSEEHARLVAEGYLDAIRGRASLRSEEPDRVHSDVQAGLPGSSVTP